MAYPKRDWDNTGNDVTKDDFKRIENGVEANDLEIAKQKNSTIPGTLAKQIADNVVAIEENANKINVLNETEKVYVLSRVDDGSSDRIAKYTLDITPGTNTIFKIRTGGSPTTTATSIQITDASNNVWIMKIQDTNVVDTMSNAIYTSFNAGGIYHVFFATRNSVNGCILVNVSHQYLAKTIFTPTITTGITFNSQHCFTLNGLKYFNLDIKKTDDSAFVANTQVQVLSGIGISTTGLKPFTAFGRSGSAWDVAVNCYTNGSNLYVIPLAECARIAISGWGY